MDDGGDRAEHEKLGNAAKAYQKAMKSADSIAIYNARTALCEAALAFFNWGCDDGD